MNQSTEELKKLNAFFWNFKKNNKTNNIKVKIDRNK